MKKLHPNMPLLICFFRCCCVVVVVVAVTHNLPAFPRIPRLMHTCRRKDFLSLASHTGIALPLGDWVSAARLLKVFCFVCAGGATILISEILFVCLFVCFSKQ